MRISCALAIGVAAALAAAPAHSQPVERTGKQIVDAQCVKCHGTGVGGAPRIGDRGAWVPRAKLGFDTLVAAAIRGHGGMPARGGMADLTDPEIRRAITYMLNPASP